MPYYPDPTPQQLAASALFLFALSRRPLISAEDDARVRLDRKVLWDLAASSTLAARIGRKEDFFESLGQLAEKTDAIRFISAAARRVDIEIARDATEWEDIYPEHVLDRLTRRAVELGFDISSSIPDELRVISRRRKSDPVEVAERTCARCREVKPIADFNRRGDGWQRYDRKCQAAKHAEWKAANPDYEATRDRSDRYSGTRGAGRDRLRTVLVAEDY
jgi:hypothetical protein